VLALAAEGADGEIGCSGHGVSWGLYL
jgi:hypothetical protein